VFRENLLKQKMEPALKKEEFKQAEGVRMAFPPGVA